MMLNGGNKPLKDYFSLVGIYNNVKNLKEISWKYKTKAGTYYREKANYPIVIKNFQIRAIVEERDLPIAPLDEEALELDE